MIGRMRKVQMQLIENQDCLPTADRKKGIRDNNQTFQITKYLNATRCICEPDCSAGLNDW
jgi:hypothetical protein